MTDISDRFVGTEKGIFEVRLNVTDRLQCPDLDMR